MRRLLLVGLLLATAGCDRVPLDPVGTDVLVAAPDLGVVFLEPDLRLRLVPAGPSGPLTLRIRNKVIDFDSTEGAFIYERELVPGLNTYYMTVTDEEGTVRFDTLHAVYLPARMGALANAGQGVARAGAAVTPVADDRALVTGGVGSAGSALASASMLRLAGAQVLSEEIGLQDARAGHTATPVAGGVLLLGGASGATLSRPADFVRSAEWVGPDGTSQRVEITGEAGGLARAGHVARAVEHDGTTYLYLLGGYVPVSDGVTVSGTLDVFRVVEGDGLRLERLSPPGGASGFAALAGSALAETGPATAAVFGLRSDEGVSLALRWSTPGTGTFPFSLRVTDAAPLQTPRTGAAAVDLGGGLSLVVGGRDADGQPLGTLEVYAAVADRTFRFPSSVQLSVPRSGHVATIFGGNRIVVGGGRPASGTVVVAYEVIQL